MGEALQTKRRTEKVWFNEKEITVRELSLRQFQDLGGLVESIEELASVFSDVENKESVDIVKAVGGMLTKAPDSLAKFISGATDLSPDEVKEGTLTEIMDIVATIIKVNNFLDAFKKKLDSLFPSK